MRLKDKVAVVTGAGAGIGRACAELFAEEGARVVIAEYDRVTGHATWESLTARGFDCLFVQTDVSDADAMRKLVNVSIEKYGRINILYNNVGGSTLDDGPVTTAPFDEFWRKMRVDVFGTWLGCHFVIPHMIAAGGGSVINAASVCGMVGTAGRDAYTAAKGAIISLTRSMAVEFGPHKVRVNAISPGSTMSERVLSRAREAGSFASQIDTQHLLGRIEPREIAYAVLYLASDESLKTTGHNMVVDSGFTIA